MTDNRQPAVLALVALTAIWSTNWIVMKLAMADAGPLPFSLLRYAGATALLFALLLQRGESLAPPPLRATALIGLTQTTGFTALAQWALVHGGAGKTALLVYTMPFWTVLLARVFLHERLRGAQWVSLLAAAGGLLLILQPWSAGLQLGSSLLAVGGGISWAAATVLSKRLFARHPVSALRLSAWQMLFGTAFLLPLAWLAPGRGVHWTPDLVGALLYNVVLASGLAWTLWQFVVQRLAAGVAGLSSLAVPLTGVLLAWALLGERPNAFEAAGIVLLGAALALLLRARRG
ncbi:putative inner membrane transporter yiJE [mine drainage metagenome]|jgi:drug/metabolite transporter (DMT)-like permease|uniref:Putative inner membrane transporter yiJE n=1 Tax=mine drainage metagenome TaxID=410659 RepID=A0A1J5QEF1_9ZZZZ